MRRLWTRFRWPIIGVAVAVVAGVAGWRGYVGWQQAQSARSGDRFMAAVELSREGRHGDALAAFEALARDGSGGYPTLARLRAAAERARNGDVPGAVVAYDSLAADGGVDRRFQDVARLRAAALLVDTGSLADVTSRIERLTGSGEPFRNSARELIGLAAYRAGDLAAAARWFDQIAGDRDASNDLRNRAQLMLAVIAADGVVPGTRS